MNVETSTQKLIHEILHVVVSQVLPRIYHSMHVRLHQICYDVDIFVSSLCGRASNIDKSNDVLMIEKFEELDFTHDSFGIDEVFESFWHFFNRYLGF